MKKKTLFVCTSCGAEYGKWLGRCTACDEWNTVKELAYMPKKAGSSEPETFSLTDVPADNSTRIQTGIQEFNLVCGGGIVPGSVLLIGGEPGIGKSTLALQIASFMDTLYVSGEESPAQISQRARRLGINSGSIHMTTATDVEDISLLADKNNFSCIIVDSIQTLTSSQVPGIAGSVSQIRETASRLTSLAKKKDIPVILIGHITKEGSIAGPKLLEHIVDTVLYFEGDFSREYRMLRAFKNRFGSINEIGLFQMTAKGLIEVTDKNRIFLNPFISKAPGNAVSAALEGSRTILFEVQSLVSFTHFSNPRRMADGFDINRLVLITAVLERHAGLKLSSFDVFLNISGGFQINETGADLAVAMAIASSLKDKAIPEKTGFIGEISLSGEIRPVSQCARRVQEFKHSGFTKIILSEQDLRESDSSSSDDTLQGIGHIQQAIDLILS